MELQKLRVGTIKRSSALDFQVCTHLAESTWYALSSSEADNNTVLMKLPVMVSRGGSIGLNGSVNNAAWTTQPEDAAV